MGHDAIHGDSHVNGDDAFSVSAPLSITNGALALLFSAGYFSTAGDILTAAATGITAGSFGGTVGSPYILKGLTFDAGGRGLAVVVGSLAEPGSIGDTTPDYGKFSSITITSGSGTWEAGAIYSDSNVGMIFRSAVQTPSTFTFGWYDYDNNHVMSVDNSGNLRLGTSTTPSPASRFTLKASTADGSTDCIVGQDSAGVEVFAVDSDGNVDYKGQIAGPALTTTTPTGTTATIDWNNGNMQALDLGSATGDVTLTLSNPKASGSYFLKIIQGATARDVVLPSTVLTPGGSAPTTLDITATNDAVDSLVLAYDGTNYLAQFAQTYG